jgi:hypothetical protein
LSLAYLCVDVKVVGYLLNSLAAVSVQHKHPPERGREGRKKEREGRRQSEGERV